MKNLILVLVAFCFIALNANAFVDNKYMTTPQYLQNTGYSTEMSKMMAVTNQDPYREPYVEKTTFKNVVKRAYSYISPGSYTDIDFYNHNININNPSWKDL